MSTGLIGAVPTEIVDCCATEEVPEDRKPAESEIYPAVKAQLNVFVHCHILNLIEEDYRLRIIDCMH